MILKDNRKILVVGSTVTDLVARTDKLPVPGQTILGEKFFMAPGGKGANQAVTIARLKGDAVFISKVGVDFFGDYVLKNIVEAGVDTAGIIRDNKNHSGVSLICLLNEGENAIVMNPGSNMALEPEEIDRMENLFETSSVLLVQLEIPTKTVEKTLVLAKKHGCITILDPAPAMVLPDIIFELSDIITPNENELEALTSLPTTNQEEIFNASCKLLDRGVSTVICTKSDGAYMTTCGEKRAYFPAIKVDAVDTTGAGDAFAGALSFRLAMGDTIEKAIPFANITAGLSVTQLGAMTSFPTYDNVKRFLDEKF